MRYSISYAAPSENGDANITADKPATPRNHLNGLSKLFIFKRVDKLANKIANVIGINDH